MLTSYVASERASFEDAFLKELIEDEEFEDYKLSHESVLLNKKHVLSEKEEAALATRGEYIGGFSDIYDTLMDTDLTFSPFKVEGKEYLMSNEKYSASLKPERIAMFLMLVKPCSIKNIERFMRKSRRYCE